MEKKVNASGYSVLTLKQESWWKKSILKKRPPLSYITDGLRAFVEIAEFRSEGKLAQLKSHQQLYVPLLRTSMQILDESEKEELSHLRNWVTWIKRHCLFWWMTIEPMKRLVLMKRPVRFFWVFLAVYLTLALNSPVKIYSLIHANKKKKKVYHINKAKYTIKCFFLHIFT